MIATLVEVTLPTSEDFLKIKETLTRIGVASKKDMKLYQSCHILHKQGHYFITHFKELFALDGKATDFTDDDKRRRNTIISLLAEWGLVKVVDPAKIVDKAPMSHIKIIAHSEKDRWTCVEKYKVGRKRQ